MISPSALRSSSPNAWPRVRRLGLSGSGVALDQRRRVQGGAARAVVRYGYERATVRRMIEPVHVSRRTFYELGPALRLDGGGDELPARAPVLADFALATYLTVAVDDPDCALSLPLETGENSPAGSLENI